MYIIKGDEGCSGTAIIPFEYESKEKFLFDIFEKYDKKYWAENPWNCQILDCYIDKYDFENLEGNIHSLEEWFEKSKEIPTI